MAPISALSHNYQGFEGLAQLRTKAKQESPEALYAVAKQFESLFLQMMLKSMRDATIESDLLDTQKTNFYSDIYDQKLSVQLANQSGIGLADLIVGQLSNNHSKRFAGVGKNLEYYRSNSVPDLAFSPTKSETVNTNQNIQTHLKSDEDLNPSFSSRQDFIKSLWPYAQHAADKLGLDPKIILSQAALETGWGKSIIQNISGHSSFNLFNIKADQRWQGPQAITRTLEFIDGVPVKKLAKFRAYKDFQQSFNDYINFLQSNPRYADALQNTADPHTFVNALQEAGYATDPEYSKKILAIYHREELASLDPPATTNGVDG